MKKLNTTHHLAILTFLMLSPFFLFRSKSDASEIENLSDCSCSALSDDPTTVSVDDLGVSITPEYNIKATKYVYRIHGDIATNKLNYDLKDYNHSQLLTYMKSKGFVGIDKLSFAELKRLNIAYNYDALFWDMHERTGFPISLFFAYFIYEATNKGIESDLWINHWNPGGIKYNNVGKFVYKNDDCVQACKFLSLPNYAAAVQQWANVFNADRYKKCKSEDNPHDICACIKSSGYHSDGSNKARSEIMKSYWSYRKHFPKTV